MRSIRLKYKKQNKTKKPIFHSSFTVLHSLQQHMRFLNASYPYQHLALLFFPLFSFLNLNFSHRCIVVSHCGFAFNFPNDWWCLASIYKLISHLSSSVMCFFKSFIDYLIVLKKNYWKRTYCWLLRVLYINSEYKSFVTFVICKYVLLVSNVFFHPFHNVLQKVKGFFFFI